MWTRLLFLIFLLGTQLFALDYSVYPTSFHLNLNKMNTEEITIINNTTNILKLQTVISGSKDFGEKYNLNDKIRIYPKILFVKPAGRQVVRFRVMPKKTEGEYLSYLTFKQLQTKNPNAKKVKDKITTSMHIFANLSLPIYGYGDNIVKSGKVKNIKIKYQKNMCILLADVKSTGNSCLRLYYKIVDNDKTYYHGRLGNSARNGVRTIRAVFYASKNIMKNKTLLITDKENKIYYKQITK